MGYAEYAMNELHGTNAFSRRDDGPKTVLEFPRTNLNEVAAHIRAIAIAHGWEDTTRSFGEEVALWHSECSEALEEYRNGRQEDEIYYSTDAQGNMKPEGIPVEAVDVLIRVLHWVARAGVDIDGVLAMKAAYNVSRPTRHGGKVL